MINLKVDNNIIKIKLTMAESDIISKNRKKNTDLNDPSVYTLYLTQNLKYIDIIDNIITPENSFDITINLTNFEEYEIKLKKLIDSIKILNDNDFALKHIKKIKEKYLKNNNIIIKAKIKQKRNKREISFFDNDFLKCLVSPIIYIDIYPDQTVRMSIEINYESFLDYLPLNIEDDNHDKLMDDTFNWLTEGEKKHLTVTRKKRNTQAKKKCIEYYKKRDSVLRCQTCGLIYNDKYGKTTTKMIIHHINPMKDKNGIYAIDPVKDLIPVCSNCHSIIHSKTKPIPIKTVKRMVNNNYDNLIQLINNYKTFINNND